MSSIFWKDVGLFTCSVVEASQTGILHEPGLLVPCAFHPPQFWWCGVQAGAPEVMITQLPSSCTVVALC